MNLIFIYGTLKRGYQRHSALANQRFLGVAMTEPKYAIYQISGFPALVEDNVLGKEIWGELYEVGSDTLEVLDEIEGVKHNLFRRSAVALSQIHFSNLPTNKEVFNHLHNKTAEAYFYQKDVSGARDCGHCWTLR